MVIKKCTIEGQLEKIGFAGEICVFGIERGSETALDRFSEVKWEIIDLLNTHYKDQLLEKFDLFDWLIYNDGDEVAYFLCEAGSNIITHSQFHIPACVRVFLGTNGFIVALEQQGEGFSVSLAMQKEHNELEGGGFAFYLRSKSVIFFDNWEEARIIYCCYLL